jgi:hypothetical protein
VECKEPKSCRHATVNKSSAGHSDDVFPMRLLMVARWGVPRGVLLLEWWAPRVKWSVWPIDGNVMTPWPTVNHQQKYWAKAYAWHGHGQMLVLVLYQQEWKRWWFLRSDLTEGHVALLRIAGLAALKA